MRLKFDHFNVHDNYRMALFHDWNGDGANVWIVKWNGRHDSVWYGVVVEHGKDSFEQRVWRTNNTHDNGWNVGASARQVAYNSGNCWRTLETAKRRALKLVRGY